MHFVNSTITRTPRWIYNGARAAGWPAIEALRMAYNPRRPDLIWEYPQAYMFNGTPWVAGVARTP